MLRAAKSRGPQSSLHQLGRLGTPATMYHRTTCPFWSLLHEYQTAKAKTVSRDARTAARNLLMMMTMMAMRTDQVPHAGKYCTITDCGPVTGLPGGLYTI